MPEGDGVRCRRTRGREQMKREEAEERTKGEGKAEGFGKGL